VDRFEKGANEMEKTWSDPGVTLMTHLRICARPGGGRLPLSVCILLKPPSVYRLKDQDGRLME
jgi:hypothetical protein